jgi:hypothetical protein
VPDGPPGGGCDDGGDDGDDGEEMEVNPPHPYIKPIRRRVKKAKIGELVVVLGRRQCLERLK